MFMFAGRTTYVHRLYLQDLCVIVTCTISSLVFLSIVKLMHVTNKRTQALLYMCYRCTAEPMAVTWNSGIVVHVLQEHCKREGGYLVDVDDAVEDTFLAELAGIKR